jgi:pimeloyl-ACP methyl ester carboxylesterase
VQTITYEGVDGLTFILVHGGFHGGWCWARVTERLRRRGARVFTPTQTGLGERAHLLASAGIDTFINDIVGVLEAEELEDVVLVGHSFGGIAVTGTVDRAPERVRHLVYLDALIVEDGQTAFDTMPEHLVAQRKADAEIHDGVPCMKAFPADAFGITDPVDVAWLERRLTPHPIGLYEERLSWRHPIGSHRPSTYVATTDPWYAPLLGSRDYARHQRDWGWHELNTGHDAMITAPAAVTDLLWRIATSDSQPAYAAHHGR